MKNLLSILLYFPLLTFGQLTEEELITIDSLKNIIKTASHDSDIVNAYFDWDNIVYVSDTELDEELNRKIIDLCKKNLAENLAKNEQLFFQDMLASSYSNLGGIEKDYGDLEKAHTYYIKSLTIAKEAELKNIEANVLNNIGILKDNQGNPYEAIDFYKKSLEIRKEIGVENKNMVSSLDNLGTVYANMGNYQESIKYFDEALKLAEKLGAPGHIAHVLLGVGLNYNNFGEHEKAIEYYEKSLKISEELGDQQIISTCLLRIGNAYSDKGDNERALEFYYQGLDISEKIGFVGNIGGFLNNIGIMLKEKGDYDSALEYYERSYKIDEELGYKVGMAGSLNSMATIYSIRDESDKCVEHLKRALQFAKEAKHIGFTKNILYNLYDEYKYYGKTKKALAAYEEYSEIKDSLSNDESKKALLRREYQYEYEKKKALDNVENEKLVAIEKEQKEKQQFITMATAGGLVLTGIFLLIVFNRLRVTRKQKLIIEDQKVEVEEQRDISNEQKLIVEEKNKEILDSISYAKRIQEAILPPPRLVKEWLTESFIFYKPKDIVAGDFYWMETATYSKGGKDRTLVYFAAADCTGHGVPGAMVSVVCANALNRAIKEFNLIEPGQVLDKVTELVVDSFDKGDEEIKDGMDIALCALDISAKKVYYSGANNPLYRITTLDQVVDEDMKSEKNDTHQLIEYKANKQPVGQHDHHVNFKTFEIQLEPGDAIYVFSDGFPDQFGGEKGKKYKYSTFRKCLLANFSHPMAEQKLILEQEFDNWKGDLEQIDDVCVIGVKINGVEKNNFTQRELEVLSYLQEGLPSKLIADKMSISKNTVDTYRRRLLAKTGTYNATELVNYCVKKEII
jgi:tetratricopeptide (TPR) repeat protein/serine phosphatase RsbU (regulator of sigma subunit)/DNA-binding CsgD family transcriptional regulator